MLLGVSQCYLLKHHDCVWPYGFTCVHGRVLFEQKCVIRETFFFCSLNNACCADFHTITKLLTSFMYMYMHVHVHVGRRTCLTWVYRAAAPLWSTDSSQWCISPQSRCWRSCDSRQPRTGSDRRERNWNWRHNATRCVHMYHVYRYMLILHENIIKQLCTCTFILSVCLHGMFL